jgi:hypothetical protein
MQTSFMPDFSVVVTTVISTAGTLLGALGGATMTHRASLRREETQANRQRKDQWTQECRQAHGELLGTARQLRCKIEIAAQRHWKDMDARLAAIQEHAESVNLHAAHVAVLAPETADAALALASAAVRLTAVTVKSTHTGHQGEGGEMAEPPSFEDLDACCKFFSDAAAQGKKD